MTEHTVKIQDAGRLQRAMDSLKDTWNDLIKAEIDKALADIAAGEDVSDLDQDGNPLAKAAPADHVPVLPKPGLNFDRVDATNPAHYQTGGVQPIDLIEALGDGPAFCRGNAMKYLARYDRKNGIEDLHKARWYLNRLIGQVEAVAE